MSTKRRAKAEIFGAIKLEQKTPISSPESDPWVDYRCPLCPSEGPDDGAVEWIQCDICDEWYHNKCLGLSNDQIMNIAEYHCQRCVKDHGESVSRRISSRKKLHLDYNALNNGDIGAIIKSESASTTQYAAKKHAYVKRFEDNSEFIMDQLPESDGGSGLTATQWVRINGIKTPVIIRKSYFHNLRMKLPANLTVTKVAELVGEDRTVEVMDVSTQLNSPGWTMAQWRDYYNSPESDREKILNVISLEFSNTKLAEQVVRPRLVRDLDLLEKVWPEELKLKNDIPKVSLYCLMSVKDSYTDFHVDFGGSSVFYHVSKGSKTFLFVEPTKKNLSAYEKWCMSSEQNSTFFADMVKECHRVDLSQGDSMIIPSGWIHAVYTPEDSLVIGGNFLTPINIPTQLHLAAIEKRTKVPQKFRFPHFTRVMWYTLIYYNEMSPEDLAALSDLEIEGIESLYQYLSEFIKPLKTEPETSKQFKNILNTIPKKLRNNPDKHLQSLSEVMRDIMADKASRKQP